jgi:hypothetical protein
MLILYVPTVSDRDDYSLNDLYCDVATNDATLTTKFKYEASLFCTDHHN